MMSRLRRAASLAAALVAASALTGCGAPTPAPPPHQLTGLFRLDPGTVAGATVRGSWFKMAVVGGSAADGPFVTNADSAASGGQVTLLAPGAAGGLRTGVYQSEAVPGFVDGNSASRSIIAPTAFFTVLFGISTNPVDPQTRAALPAPTVTETGGVLTADLSSWAASWNNQEFNQGAPKPIPRTGPATVGEGQVSRAWDWVSHRWLAQPAAPTVAGPTATGTFDAATRRFTLDWTSHIVGGPFNDFTGVWHLEGTFESQPAAPG